MIIKKYSEPVTRSKIRVFCHRIKTNSPEFFFYSYPRCIYSRLVLRSTYGFRASGYAYCVSTSKLRIIYDDNGISRKRWYTTTFNRRIIREIVLFVEMPVHDLTNPFSLLESAFSDQRSFVLGSTVFPCLKRPGRVTSPKKKKTRENKDRRACDGTHAFTRDFRFFLPIKPCVFIASVRMQRFAVHEGREDFGALDTAEAWADLYAVFVLINTQPLYVLWRRPNETIRRHPGD